MGSYVPVMKDWGPREEAGPALPQDIKNIYDYIITWHDFIQVNFQSCLRHRGWEDYSLFTIRPILIKQII